METNQALYFKIGGRPYLEKVAKRFYDKLYAHPWMHLFFKNTKQEVIERQQVDFMTGILGGPKVYAGRMPLEAHTHINITPEVFNKRQELLIEALQEEGASEELIDRWIKVDEAFRRQILKKSVSECKGRWATEEILDFEDPEKFNKEFKRTS